MSTSATTNEREEGLAFQPKFDASGLVTCVATDAATGDVLMVAHMNDEALRKTIASGDAWYFSRSRNALWRKGETSGQTQRVVEMRMVTHDCHSSMRTGNSIRTKSTANRFNRSVHDGCSHPIPDAALPPLM